MNKFKNDFKEISYQKNTAFYNREKLLEKGQ